MTESVLAFERVAVEGGHLYDSALWQVDFRLERGQLALIHLEESHLRIPMADAAQGLVDPVQGRVAYRGRCWSAHTRAEKLAARASIGRVFDEPGWISALDMDENITLAQSHHTKRSAAEIRDEASLLARQFSLPGLPQGRPGRMRAPALRRAACVRALMGHPDRLILERPTAGVYPAIMPPLVTGLRAARARGAAVLWLTDDWNVWNDAGIKPTFRAKMTGSQMTVLPGE